MLHRIKIADEGRTDFIFGAPFKLEAKHSLVIPALCQGAIPHGLCLESYQPDHAKTVGYSFIMLVGEPEVLTSHSLIIVPRPVVNGDVFTYVFNLSNQQLRIRRGEVLSRLVRVEGSIWT